MQFLVQSQPLGGGGQSLLRRPLTSKDVVAHLYHQEGRCRESFVFHSLYPDSSSFHLAPCTGVWDQTLSVCILVMLVGHQSLLFNLILSLSGLCP